MTTSQTEKLEATAQYEAFKQIPKAHRTQDMQNVIYEYEQGNGITNESEKTELIPPLILNAQQKTTQEQQATTLFHPSSVEPDSNMVEFFSTADSILDSQLPKFKDERIKTLFKLSGASSIGAKWSRHTIIASVVEENYGRHFANTVGMLSFAHSTPKTSLSKAVKEAQFICPYITIAATCIDAPRNTQLDGVQDDQIKRGNELHVHLTPSKYLPNDNNIAILEDIFVNEVIPDGEKLTIFSSSVQRSRYLLSLLNEAQVAQPLIEKLKASCPPQVKAEKYNGWIGILAMALLTSQEHFYQMWELMIEISGTEPLAKKYKLAVALELVIPTYETMLEGCNVTTNQTISTTMLKTLLKGIGYNESGLSDTFADLGFLLKEYKSGIPLPELKLAYEALVQDNDKRIQSYRKQLNT